MLLFFIMRLKSTFIEIHRQSLLLYAADLGMLLAAFGGFFRDGFGNDTIWFMVEPQYGINTWYTNGRYLAYAVSEVLYKAGFVATDHYKECFILFLFLLSVSILLIQKTILYVMGDRFDSNIRMAGFAAATGLLYINVLFTEDFMFAECFLGYPFAYVLAAAAVYLIIVRNRNKTGLLCLFLASMFYQVALVQAAMILAVCIVFKFGAKLTPALIRREIVSAVSVIGMIVINYAAMKILAALGITYWSAKNAGVSDVSDKVAFLLQQAEQLFESSLQLLPPVFLPLLFSALCLFVLFAVLIKKRQKGEILTVILLLLLLTGLLFLIPFLQTPTGFNPRIVYVFYTIQAMTYFLALFFENEKLHYRTILSIAVCGWLVIQTVFCNVIMANHYLSNQLDLTYGRMVYNEVLDYEQETGTKVTKIAVVNDTNSPHTYDEVEYKRDQINERVLSIEPYCLFMYVSGRNITEIVRVDMDLQIYDTCFKGKNWDYFDPEQQVLIKGDTLYWCVF